MGARGARYRPMGSCLDLQLDNILDFLDTPGYASRFLTGRAIRTRFWEAIVGAVAQLVERLNGIQEVRGSIPLRSTGQNFCLRI